MSPQKPSKQAFVKGSKSNCTKKKEGIFWTKLTTRPLKIVHITYALYSKRVDKNIESYLYVSTYRGQYVYCIGFSLISFLLKVTFSGTYVCSYVLILFYTSHQKIESGLIAKLWCWALTILIQKSTYLCLPIYRKGM